MMRAALLLSCAALTGCGVARTVQVRVPVPVACQEQVPSRPAMPLEALRSADARLEVLLPSALAEIDLREGYEQMLRTALLACTAP